MAGKTYNHVVPPKIVQYGVLTPASATTHESELLSVENRNVEDVSAYLFEVLSRIMEQSLGMEGAGALEGATVDMKPEEVASINDARADYTLQLFVGHIFVYYPLNWGRYKLAGQATFNIIKKDGTLVSSDYCKFPSVDVSDAPKYDQLFDEVEGAMVFPDEPTELKRLLKRAKTHCEKQFKDFLRTSVE